MAPGQLTEAIVCCKKGALMVDTQYVLIMLDGELRIVFGEVVIDFASDVSLEWEVPVEGPQSIPPCGPNFN